MKFFYRFQTGILAAVLFFSACPAIPVRAAEAEEITVSGPVTEYGYTTEQRYELPIQSDSWENWPAGPKVYAESAIVMEASTGTILYAKNIDEPLYPASITKIMTALLTLENTSLDEEVTFSHNAAFNIEYGSSSIARDEGEILTIEECLYGLMLESANECALALAEHISGSTEAFAELMNEKAAELGCTNTHFVTPNGLHNDNHYTSAHDMALITRAAISHEEFRRISGSAHYILRTTNKNDNELWMNNHHYMICSYKTSKFLDDTVFAGKTGYTTNSLNTLMTCATRGGMDLVVITMKTQGSGEQGVPIYTDTENLLNYASENFRRVNIAENETNFTIGQNEMFNTGTSIFGTTTPMIEMNTDGYVILPNNVDFSEATPQLEFIDSDDSTSDIASLSYTYAGQRIGSTTLYLTQPKIQEFEFHNTDDNGQIQETTPKKLLKINIRVVVTVVAVLGIAALLGLLIWRLQKNFNFSLHFPRIGRGGPDRNSFSDVNRRRYRSKKRRFNKWRWRK